MSPFAIIGRLSSGLHGAGSGAPGRALQMSLLLALLVSVALACNATSGGREKEVVARFLLGGWVVPRNEPADAEPFVETLKASVFTTEPELRLWLDGLDVIRVRGNFEALDGADLDEVVVLGAYYLWRPLRGDPLFITRTSVNGAEVLVSLELEGDPQGREFPYLMAPLYIASLEREDLPRGVPLTFVFSINGEVAATQKINLQ